MGSGSRSRSVKRSRTRVRNGDDDLCRLCHQRRKNRESHICKADFAAAQRDAKRQGKLSFFSELKRRRCSVERLYVQFCSLLR